MPIPVRPLLPLALTTAVLLAGAAFLAAAPAAPRPASLTPQQVADTLDGIVQPRFQQNAGFLAAGNILVDGHDAIYLLSGAAAQERRDFRRINAAHRPYVVALLECAHTWGHYAHSKQQAAGSVQTYLKPLAAATVTEERADTLRLWAGDNLGKVVLPNLADLRRGSKINKDFGNWCVAMRPVLASRPSCLGCHAGAKKNEMLGVMVYAVDKNAIKDPLSAISQGSDQGGP